MKKILRKALLAVALQMVLVYATGQDAKKYSPAASPEWVSEKGYWVIESNIKNNRGAVIYFYNFSDRLIYSEKLESIKLKLRKKKTLMKLKIALESAIMQWGDEPSVKHNSGLIAKELLN
jgi:hypothetical protein